MEIPVASGAKIHAAAVRLAVDLGHHLFGALYHAAALTLPEALPAAADEPCCRKARLPGRIRRLSDLA